jgi:endoglucanase
VDEVRTDVMGSVIGIRRCGKADARKLLFEAHMDEVGLIITGHEDGFLRFTAIGGVDARMLPNAEIKILTDPPIVGVVAVAAPHVLREEDSDKTIKLEDLSIDIGLGQEEARKAVPLGTPALYNTAVRPFGELLMCGKGLDDRICLSSVLYALELLKSEKLDVDLRV